MHASDPPRSLRLRRSFWKTVSIYPRSAPVRHIRLRSFAVLCGECLYFMNFWAVDLLQIRYAAILAWFCPRFCSWFWPILYFFSLRDINLTLDSCPPEDTWYGVMPWVLRVLGQGLKSECADIFHQSGCRAILTSLQKGETAV